MGALTNFATEANDFSTLFHGIDLRLLTLSTNFHMPIFREFLMALGVCSVSRKSCDNILNKGPGHSLMIVVGGAAESLFAFPNTYDLVIKKRFGFIKLAVMNGASLVPVMSFGENDIWDQVANPQGSILRSVQLTFKKYMTFAPPLFHGRGIFSYNYGVLPHRRPITSVVGSPIDCPKIENPNAEDVQKYQKLYLDELQRIYDKYKDQYAPNRSKELSFVQ